MSVEQSIFTCAKARRETGTTGFGIYSQTSGMEELLSSSTELNKIHSNYSAPRNQELWWHRGSEREEERDRIETENIKKHHPVSFFYKSLNIDNKEKLVFAFGKNIGRDIEGVRPGNVMVNTVVCDPEDIVSYPFEYYGSKEICPDYDRAFFASTGDIPADDLKQPESVEKGSLITFEDIRNFISEVPDRTECVMSMFQFLMDYNDKNESGKQILICDKKENIILWIATLSVIFPAELAKKISFNTYSFLGDNSTNEPVYEDAMICGLYSPVLNGDPEDSGTTNYDFSYESSKNNFAVFDFENNFFSESDERFSNFKMFVENSLKSNIDSLKPFHDFIISKTSYRAIGNDYARGYSYYMFTSFPGENSLKHLSDAERFASQYMGREALSELLLKAFSFTVDKGEISSGFEQILSLAEECIKKQTVPENLVLEKYKTLLDTMIFSDNIQREEFFSVKDKVKELFNICGLNLDIVLSDLLTSEKLADISETCNKKWKLLMISEIMCNKIASLSEDRMFSDNEYMVVFRKILLKVLFSENEHRLELVNYFSGIFKGICSKVSFYNILYNDLSNAESAQSDVLNSLVEFFSSCSNNDKKLVIRCVNSFDGFAGMFAKYLIIYLNHKADFNAAENCIRILIENACGNYEKIAYSILINISDRDKNTSVFENISRTKKLLEDYNCLDEETKIKLCSRYKEAVLEKYKWYEVDESVIEIWISNIIDSDISQKIFNDKEITNIFIMWFVRYKAESKDGLFLYESPKTIWGKLDFSLINPEDREKCITILSDALYRHSLYEKTAYLHFEYFIKFETADEVRIHDKIIYNWFDLVVKKAPKEYQSLFLAQLLTVAYSGKANIYEFAELMYTGKIKLRDVEQNLDSDKVYNYSSKTVKNSLNSIDNIINMVNEKYEELEQGTIKGWVKSFAKKIRKNKEE